MPLSQQLYDTRCHLLCSLKRQHCDQVQLPTKLCQNSANSLKKDVHDMPDIYGLLHTIHHH